mmetsp:Transcript_22023/g.24508  ORF Transcript_22023/g.24508 Transcript_22023/m.24508 type:complete len:240 (-) Transcript_22023:113-832(-)
MKFITAPLLIAASIASSCSAFSPTNPNKSPTVSSSPGTTSSVPKIDTSLEAFGRKAAVSVPVPVYVEPESVLEPIFDTVTDVLTFTLRIGTCALLIHHGIDKIDNVAGFSANVVAKFFGFLPGDPQFWTLSAAGTQIVGSVLLSVGFLARPVALSMCATMAVAVIFHLLNTGAEGFPLAVVPQHSYNFELAAMYVAVLTYFAASGAGPYSVDNLVLGGELKFYESKFKSIFGGDDSEEE